MSQGRAPQRALAQQRAERRRGAEDRCRHMALRLHRPRHREPRYQPEHRDQAEEQEHRAPSDRGQDQPASVPKAGPKATPETMQPLAKPSFSTGRFSAISLERLGNAVLSPMPSSTRSASRLAKPPASPVSAVASDQIAKPSASAR